MKKKWRKQETPSRLKPIAKDVQAEPNIYGMIKQAIAMTKRHPVVSVVLKFGEVSFIIDAQTNANNIAPEVSDAWTEFKCKGSFN